MLAILSLLRPLLPYLAGVLVLLGIYWAGDMNGAHRVQRKFDAFVASERDAVSKVQSAWDAERASTEKSALRALEHRREIFVGINNRVHDLPPPIAHLAIPGLAVDILSDAIARANQSAQPPGQPSQTAASDTNSQAQPLTASATDQPVELGRLLQWQVEVLEWAAECRDRVDSWAQFYSGLRSVP